MSQPKIPEFVKFVGFPEDIPSPFQEMVILFPGLRKKKHHSQTKKDPPQNLPDAHIYPSNSHQHPSMVYNPSSQSQKPNIIISLDTFHL